MEFQVITRGATVPHGPKETIYLKIDHWNDHSFVTMFSMTIFDQQGQRLDVGDIKIGFRGQTEEKYTYTALDEIFNKLNNNFFSLGQDVNFYKKIATLSDFGLDVLLALRDIVVHPDLLDEIKEENVFGISLLRSVSLSVIRGQFARVLEGKAERTNFKFRFIRPESDLLGSSSLSFNVAAESTPSTNIHAVIGRNGVGKTTLLNGMISAITDKNNTNKFFDEDSWVMKEISESYFSSLVSVSFSAFDPFSPPQEQPDPSKGTCYFYIGLKDLIDAERHRTIPELQDDCIKALATCFYKKEKTERWLNAINKLGSDENFASMQLSQLQNIYQDIINNTAVGEKFDPELFHQQYKNAVNPYLVRMSSGHAIVLLIITRLVALVEEKTLVLMDEPESHLHPPLLSAFIRALADLLHDRNGVAIIATHSPVVLQEIPKSCAWKLHRVGKSVSSSRLTNETFGENVGLLTSEVFSLEVERSGFHELLANSVKSGKTYEQIVKDYNQQLGFEARSILRSLVANRDRSKSNDATI